MAAVTVALIGFFGFLLVRFSQPPMATLYSDLALQDSASIVKDLERAGTTYELRADGSTILVPKAEVARLRMKMAEAGLPRGGSVGYEIFDKSDSLGTTSFVQNINQLRALEGELARTIRAIERIQQARVHLVIPERALFSRDKQDPSASIALRVQGGLEAGQIRAIRHLVASAVQGLKPERVSIVDEAGRLLADGAGDANGALGTAGDDRVVSYERRVKNQVEEIVGSVVGQGRARVQVNAELDFNRITQTSDSFDPESRVVRSTQNREESQVSTEGRDGQVSVGNELPNATAQGAGGQVRDQSKKSEETVNYEISRTTRTEVVEGGRIKRVSVAVVVDGAYSRDANGNVTYSPRNKEELDRITALVRSAIGYDQKRGDQIEVVNLRFAEGPPPGLPEDEGWLSRLKFGKDDVMQAAELGVLLLLTLMVVLMVVRPMVRRIVVADKKEEAAGAVAGPGELPTTESPPLTPEQIKETETTRKIAYAKIQGQLHAQSIAKVGELVDQNPQETVAIIRQWIHQDSPDATPR
ncbi:Flagellar M-ring protein [Blastochloris viridis]|uniref:Flagellar M-ring protein n=2 Tax=Blastochloris viridis TaxID=1079 RepID=A0A0S4Q3X5_BLAVI|nr:flagellar basal-body MS-ring/collar protein FliF [Blastochloris viridis]CUU43015.1 Flagellar M-ring protein [Blastochloris viridis]